MNISSRLLPVFILVSLPVAWAVDVIGLADGNSLRGTVRSIEKDGRVVVESDLSPKPLLLRGDSLRSIDFDVPASPLHSHSELLFLANGDVLPATVQGLDGEALSVETWYAGSLQIPRRFVSSIEFGVAPQKQVFKGPTGLAGWKDNNDWTFEDGKLVCESSGTISRPGILPEQFILRFRLEWENNPKFRIYFCDDHLKRIGDEDRYYFEINSMGFQLRRQTSDNERRWFPLASSSRRPEEFPGRSVDVELRVDRRNRLIYLYMNGEKEGRFPDPIDAFPTGTGIMLESQAGGDLKNIIPMIEVYEWDAVSHLRRSEGHEDPETDAVVDVTGEHISGEALRLEEAGGVQQIVLKSPFADDPLTIRTQQVSSLYLKRNEDLPDASSRIRFEIQGGGRLQLSTLELGEQTLRAVHPFLGEMTFRREALQQLSVTPQGEENSDSDP